MIVTQIAVKVNEDREFIFRAPAVYKVLCFDKGLMSIAYDSDGKFEEHTFKVIRIGEEFDGSSIFIGSTQYRENEIFIFIDDKHQPGFNCL